MYVEHTLISCMLEHDFESDLIFKAAISLEWDHHLVHNPLSLNGCTWPTLWTSPSPFESGDHHDHDHQRHHILVHSRLY